MRSRRNLVFIAAPSHVSPARVVDSFSALILSVGKCEAVNLDVLANEPESLFGDYI